MQFNFIFEHLYLYTIQVWIFYVNVKHMEDTPYRNTVSIFQTIVSNLGDVTQWVACLTRDQSPIKGPCCFLEQETTLIT